MSTLLVPPRADIFHLIELFCLLQRIEKKNIYVSLPHVNPTERGHLKQPWIPCVACPHTNSFKCPYLVSCRKGRKRKALERTWKKRVGRIEKKRSPDSCTLGFSPDGCPIRGHSRAFCELKKETGQGLEAGYKEPSSPFSTI